MNCIMCNAPDTKVSDSRLLEDGLTIRRRRKCEICQKRFTTYEKVVIQMPAIVKRDGRRENYDKEKILSGVRKSCQKRPVSTTQVEAVVEAIEKHIWENYVFEITTRQIGDMVMEKLQALDTVAYVRFACNYLDFTNIEDFVGNLQTHLTKNESTQEAPRGNGR